MRIADLFQIFSEEFGLKYSISQPRPCEKIHEIMASQDEVPRIRKEHNFYLMHQKEIYNEVKFPNNQYSSQDSVIGKDQLYQFLQSKNFYKPQ
jgi:UDP-glucose 4-epimerase